MLDVKKIKSVMTKSAGQKLIIVTEDENFVIVTLDEYQRLLDSQKFLDQVTMQETSKIIRPDDESMGTDIDATGHKRKANLTNYAAPEDLADAAGDYRYESLAAENSQDKI